MDDPPKVAPNPWWLNPENDTFDGQSAGMLRHLEELDLSEALRRAQSWKIANGRAAARSRRYFVQNQLRYMWVLTFAREHHVRGEVMGLVSEFARDLRSRLGVTKMPYWYSPELHPGGHGWHVNFFINVRVSHDLFASEWGEGYVWVTDFADSLRGPKGEPLGLCRTPREGLRRAAQYGCKYSQKDWSPEHVGHRNHRYEVAQGFTPQVEKVWTNGPREAERIISQVVPESDRVSLSSWDSQDDENWNGPRARIWKW
jgi:hypothetical protein